MMVRTVVVRTEVRRTVEDAGGRIEREGTQREERKKRWLVVVTVEDGGGCVYNDDDGGRRNEVRWENRERRAHAGKRGRRGVGIYKTTPALRLKCPNCP
jgi:hypothetical protein